MPRIQDLPTREERSAALVGARREARYRAARRRVEQILAGAPPLTDAQRADLADILRPSNRDTATPSGSAPTAA